jgi:hypothetical protein
MGIPLMQSMHCTGMGSYPQAAGSGQSGMLIPSCVVFTPRDTHTHTHTHTQSHRHTHTLLQSEQRASLPRMNLSGVTLNSCLPCISSTEEMRARDRP